MKITKHSFVSKEYADVFANALPRKPPKRKVEFTIELLPRTDLISFPTYYKMATIEMVEL